MEWRVPETSKVKQNIVCKGAAPRRSCGCAQSHRLRRDFQNFMLLLSPNKSCIIKELSVCWIHKNLQILVLINWGVCIQWESNFVPTLVRWEKCISSLHVVSNVKAYRLKITALWANWCAPSIDFIKSATPTLHCVIRMVDKFCNVTGCHRRTSVEWHEPLLCTRSCSFDRATIKRRMKSMFRILPL